MASPEQRRGPRQPSSAWSQSIPDKNPSSKAIFKMFGHLGLPVLHRAGSVLFEEGEVTTGVYLIQTGQIKLSCTAGRDRSMILRIARTGEILGLATVLNGCGHEMTAKTLTECDLTHIAPDVFMDFLRDFAEASTQALVALARDHREVLLSARRLALFPLASSRMAQVLLAFSHAEGTESISSSFSMLLTHSELASLIGTTRETVTRILNEWERNRIIERDEALIRIIKPAKLARLAN